MNYGTLNNSDEEFVSQIARLDLLDEKLKLLYLSPLEVIEPNKVTIGWGYRL